MPNALVGGMSELTKSNSGDANRSLDIARKLIYAEQESGVDLSEAPQSPVSLADSETLVVVGSGGAGRSDAGFQQQHQQQVDTRYDESLPSDSCGNRYGRCDINNQAASHQASAMDTSSAATPQGDHVLGERDGGESTRLNRPQPDIASLSDSRDRVEAASVEQPDEESAEAAAIAKADEKSNQPQTEISRNEHRMGPLLLNQKSFILEAGQIDETAKDKTNSADEVQRDDKDRSTNIEDNKSTTTIGSNVNATTATTTIAQPNISERKIPQRKVSVFSLNGFPDIQMLDQQNLKTRSAEEAEQSQSQFVKQQVNSSGVADREKKLENEQMATNTSKQLPQLAQTTDTKNRVSMRQTTLGSTGSSRASSCDEPTIVALSASRSSISASSCPIPINNADLSERKLTTTTDSALKRKVSSDRNSSGSSSSSLDSFTWPMLSTGSGEVSVKQEQNSQAQSAKSSSFRTTNSDNSSEQEDSQVDADGEQLAPVSASVKKLQRAPSVPPPPFESIKSQLKHNSMPNAQLIQRHIDNLISQNEAIIDNWNLVSIRSYNSSASQRECVSCKRPSSSSCDQDHELPHSDKQQVGGLAPLQTKQAHNHNKRWSTTALMTSSTSGAHQPLMSSASNSSNFSSATGSSTGYSSNSSSSPFCQQTSSSCDLSAVKTTGDLATKSLPHSMSRQHIERKRSYNLSRKVSGSNLNHGLAEPIFPLARSQFPLAEMVKDAAVDIAMEQEFTECTGSSSPTNECNNNRYTGTKDAFGVSAMSPVCQLEAVGFPQEPSQLEDAIENLSLKKGEDQHQQQNRSKSMQYFGLNDDLATASTFSADQRQSNLIFNQYQQQQQQQQLGAYPGQQEIVMAALLMERHRQQTLLAAAQQQQLDFESQAAILRQQQQQQHQYDMIEQQLEQQLRLSQLVASIEQKNEHQMALANAFASNNAYIAATRSMQNNPNPNANATTNLTPNPNTNPFHNHLHDHHHHHPFDRHSLQTKPTALPLASYLSEQQALDSQLLKSFLSQVMPTSQKTIAEPRELVVVNNLEHGAELLTQSLDSAKPTHRCDSCDISFWTKDLLNYHLTTQCSARSLPAQASFPPAAFKFGGGPNTSGNTNGANFEQTHLSHKQLSKSVSPPRRPLFNSVNNGSGANIKEHAPEAHENRAVAEKEATSVARSVRRGFSSSWKPVSSDISILKQQLLTMPTNAPPDTLPFKKRKISEPNMRY